MRRFDEGADQLSRRHFPEPCIRWTADRRRLEPTTFRGGPGPKL